MPATYAAVSASLNALREIRPDFAPTNLLDVGAGPGTATWAAAAAFPSLTSLALLDSNSALRALALDLGGDSTRLLKMTYQHGEARAALADSEAADLVIASYMIGEIGDAERPALAALMWEKTRDTLLIVEPGTPAGYARIIALRRQLIAAGANVAAPCPHDGECPILTPDWCHFTQRLPRSRVHKQLKSAELPYEDEKFSYLALTRVPAARHPARVIAQPVVTKVAVTARLCTDQGILNASAARRQKAAYQRFKKIAWGDAIFDADHGQAE
jgi:ribosomal protein RSM22 (predicted rRNA methylase)